MNKSQRIVVSIVGIVIVGIALLSLAYGYFLTRIIGNSSEKSISGKMNKLELTYDDQKSTINVTGIKPGDIVGTKTFTVKNNGNDTVESYAVVLENVKNTLQRKDDLLFSLTCSSNCNGVEETVFPADDTVIVTNSIDKGETQTYELTVKYKNFKNTDQSIDMDAEFGAKVNIADTRSVNPYTRGTLAYEIFNNALFTTSETGTKFSYAPLTKPAQEIISSTERTLSAAPDKYGNSYYFRGNIEDNYVTFASMCWRVVRIQGDGSVKVVLASAASCESATGLGVQNLPVTTSVPTSVVYGTGRDYRTCSSNCMRTNLQNWFNGKFTSSSSTQSSTSNTKPTLTSTYTNKLKYETWEIGDWETQYKGGYEPSVRLKNISSADRYASLMPSTSKKNVTVNDYVATLTADEVVLSGAIIGTRGCKSFLCNGTWYTLTVAGSPNPFGVTDDTLETNVSGWIGYLPAIILMPSVTATGSGTSTLPYVIS